MNDEMAVQRVAETLEEVRRVLQDPEPAVNDQHLVSCVLLKRFAAHNGPDARSLVPFNLAHPSAKHRPRSPKACGKLAGFVKFGSGHLERHVWKPIEDALPSAFKALDSGTLFDHPEHVDTIKKAIALHYVRSTQIRDLQRGLWPEVVARQQAWWLGPGRPLLDHAFYRRHRLYPAGARELVEFIRELMEPWTSAAETELLFDARLENLFQQGCALIANTGLEILTPERGQFLIGDVPALTIRHDRFEAGVRNGIAIGDANTIVLPLGPRHLAAIGPVNAYGTIPVDARDRLNAIQIQHADNYVYLQPGSQLEDFVRKQQPLRTVCQFTRWPSARTVMQSRP